MKYVRYNDIYSYQNVPVVCSYFRYSIDIICEPEETIVFPKVLSKYDIHDIRS